jgi:predicted dienelactone hydrolase
MRALAAVLVASLAGCGGDAAPAVDPLALPVDQRGPFRVGYTELTLRYPLPADDGEREIAVGVWYPTEDETGYTPVYLDLFRDPDVFEDAIPAPPVHTGGYPVLAYSHGFRGFGGTSADLMGYVASHGWVAVAPSHTDNLLFDDAPLPTSHYFARSLDISVSLDALDELALAGPIVTDRVVLSGHSFGTFTTWATAGAPFDEATMRGLCARGELPQGGCTEAELQVFLAGLDDPRVVAVIPMAGGDRGWFTANGYAQAEVPAMLMTGTADSTDGAAFVDRATGVDLTWASVEGGCHQLFALGGCQDIPSDQGFAIVNTLAFAFARHHLLADDSAGTLAILDGSRSVSERVSLVHRGP